MAKKLMKSTWGQFSNAFVKFQGLPHGCTLRLVAPTGRARNSNKTVTRKGVNRANLVERLDDDERVSKLIETAVGLLTDDLYANGDKVELYGPDKSRVNGGTKLRNVRAFAPALTADEIEQEENRWQEVDDIKPVFAATISDAEYLRSDPEFVVCTAALRALIERYGRSCVEENLRNC